MNKCKKARAVVEAASRCSSNAAAAETTSAATPAAGPGSSRIAAPADRSTAPVELAAEGGSARLTVGTGDCIDSSLVGVEPGAILSDMSGRPGGLARRARVSADVWVVLFLIFGAHTTKRCKTITKKKKKVEKKQADHGILGKVEEIEDQSTDQGKYHTNDYMF